jgi:PKD repeat protein
MGVIQRLKEKGSLIFFILLFTVFVVIPILKINTTPPTAEYINSPPMPLVGETVTFTAKGSKSEGSIKITSYEWDFGDGGTASGYAVNHTYTKVGTYDVMLTVKNERGRTGTAQKTVTADPPLALIRIDTVTSTYLNSTLGTTTVEEDVRDSLRRACFLVTPKNNDNYDASLLVDYKEEEYAQFVNEQGLPVGKGTKIICDIKLIDEQGFLLYERGYSAATGGGTYIFQGPLPDLYRDAYYKFKYDVYFKYLGDMLATKFGIGDEFNVLVSASKDEVYSVRLNALDALKELDEERAVEPITSVLLSDEETTIRIHAAEALGQIGGEAVVEPLIEALGDENSLVRANVAEALGKVGDERAVGPLTDLLNDDSESVRRNAEEALERIQSQ